jgi:WD40 repeat protein
MQIAILYKYNRQSYLNNTQFHAEDVWSIALNSDRIASGSFAKTIKIWDPKTGKCLGTQ